MDESTRKLRILVVEDSEGRQFALRRLYGTHDLVVVESAAEARAQLASEHFDLVSLDYDLGVGGRGDEVARFLADRDQQDTEVIVHSMHLEGVRAIKAFLPNVIELPVSLLDGGTPWSGRLRSELDSGRPIDWDYVLVGRRQDAK